MPAYDIEVFGIVQGVGFRPFIYRLAKDLSLSGYVYNTSKGVFIHVQSENKFIDEFINKIKTTCPNISYIEKVIVHERSTTSSNLLKSNKNEIEIENEKSEFKILKSKEVKENNIYIAPDFSTCPKCKQDILNKDNRRYNYPFTTCTYCGPRYSIINAIPYDRKKTTMKEFKMCPLCSKEYINPQNRRYHSQPNACKICGPKLSLYNTIKGIYENTTSPLSFISKKLLEGKIVSIKGLGGYLLCVDAKNNDAVKLLRKKKQREAKPFALMCKDIEIAKKYCNIDEFSKKLLLSPNNPIVLIKKIANTKLASSISLDNDYLGIMLPYTPIHILLMEKIDVLVMTSANISDTPIIKDDDEAILKLSNIADYILIHNRKIQNKIDDSVFKIINDKPQALRRARGYVPGILKTNGLNKTILAVGAELKNTFCINRKNTIFIGPHIGDLKNLETYNFFKNSILNFLDLLGLKPEVIACDMHPQYISTKWAKEDNPNIKVIEVQHHHAHIVSTMVEYGLDKPVIGIAMDGTGLGTDGNIWGCECAISSFKSFNRLGHLDYFKLPGGDICAYEVYRCALSLLSSIDDNFKITDHLDIDKYNFLREVPNENINFVNNMLKKDINIFKTSSMGRLFDGISSILGLSNYAKYEAAPAILLENAADTNLINTDESYEVIINYKEGKYIWNWQEMIALILNDISKSIKVSIISAKFHNSVVNYILKMAVILKKETGINDIVLSGGVFLNSWISSKSCEKLKDMGFNVYLQRMFPPGDGGLCIGQLKIANEVT